MNVYCHKVIKEPFEELAYQQGREDERNNIGIFLRRRNLYALEKDYEKWLKEKNNG